MSIEKELSRYFDSFYPKEKHDTLRENRLKRMDILLDRLNHPERSMRVIHIAGSKGKGTTSYIIAKALSLKGYRSALFMSPHVYDIRERFTLPDTFFRDEEYEDTLNELKRLIEGLSFEPSLGPKEPTTFEMYLAYALLLFKKSGVEYAVIETGLGGRLDATNALSPIAAIITQIELEHTNILGDTIEKIAYEKGGIIKEGVPTFIGNLVKEAKDKIISIANERKSKLYILGDYKDNRAPLSSKKEEEDRLLALMALETLHLIDPRDKLDIKLDLPARLEKRAITYNGKSYNILIDGAHTPYSISNLIETIENKELKKDSALIFSLTEGKDIDTIERELFPLFNKIVITTTGSFKRSPVDEIYSNGKKYISDHTDYTLLESPKEALLWALDKSSSIIVTGSFYLASEINDALKIVLC